MKEKVNWRLQYSVDNTWNISVNIILLLGVIINYIHPFPFTTLVVIICFISFMINISSLSYFNKNKYE